MDPPPLIDLNDTDDVVSSVTSHSYTDRQGTKIFDRYLSSPSPSPSSSDEDDGGSQPSNSTIKRLDYMMDFLDRKLSTNESNKSKRSSSLPEFIANGGDIPMFRPPLRAAVHPARPASLEVRPHPLRETQKNCFLKTIVCTEKELWAGGENGLRVWSLNEMYNESASEEGTAPFKKSVKEVASVMCMVGDEGSGVLWSGHTDGWIRCWKMNHAFDEFKEDLSWQAHSGPVFSLCVSSYGINSLHTCLQKMNC